MFPQTSNKLHVKRENCEGMFEHTTKNISVLLTFYFIDRLMRYTLFSEKKQHQL